MEFFLIGEILNTKGVKGELKVRAFTDFTEDRFGVGNQIYINYENKYIKKEIIKFSENKKNVFITLKGMEDINLVEKFKNCEVYTDMQQEIELQEGEYYANDLKGIEVYQGDVLKGKVHNVRTYPQGDYIDVVDLENNHHLIPFRDEFIVKLDLDYNRIDIIEMEGLL